MGLLWLNVRESSNMYVCPIETKKVQVVKMRHGASGRRQRNRGGNRRGGNQRTQVFDSNGPDVRIRGTAHQIFEKYTALAKDAAGMGDRIMEQSYLQHAEHYMRLINSWQDDGQESRRVATPADGFEADENQQPRSTQEDLGLPTSIVGAKQEEMEVEEA